MHAVLHAFAAARPSEPLRFDEDRVRARGAARRLIPTEVIAAVAVAYVFPGQGSQTVGMGRLLSSHSPAAAAIFAQADAVLGQPLSRLAWEGPGPTLDLTVNAQPALLAASIALLGALREAAAEAGVSLTPPSFFAGHSMGQYSAMVAGGVLSLADGLRLVRTRGELMQASAQDGAMAAIIGLPDEQIPQLEAAGSAAGVFTIANRNSPGQIVVSGERVAVQAATEAAKQLGARRAIVLAVSVAAHSPLMARAADGMRDALASVEFRDPAAPLLANADGHSLTTGAACRDELVEHLTRGVDWVRAVETMRDAGVETFVEVGPGKVLTNLITRIAPEVHAIPLDDPAHPGALNRTLIADTTMAPAP
jgi:[acyl-carrier-protein] S-malonyltransferase